MSEAERDPVFAARVEAMKRTIRLRLVGVTDQWEARAAELEALLADLKRRAEG